MLKRGHDYLADQEQRMRSGGSQVVVLGSRGIPGIPGGIEKHCEELYSRLAACGETVVVVTRSPYRREWPTISTWRGVALRKLWAPRLVGAEALVHTLLGLFVALRLHARLVHIHGIGPGLVVPLARAMGLKVVFTHHGFDYRRQKWGGIARLVLRAGEQAALRWAHASLVVSREVQRVARERWGLDTVYTPNGTSLPEPGSSRDTGVAMSRGLSPDGYAVTVARLVPEKGWDTLLESATKTSVPLFVGIGGSHDRTAYSERLALKAPPTVRFLGALEHAETLALVRAARLFVLPSLHEGLPIALLEAMAAGTLVVASDIEANREVITDGSNGFLFPAGDASALARVLDEAWSVSDPVRRRMTEAARATVADRYGWDQAVRLTREVYGSLAPCA